MGKRCAKNAGWWYSVGFLRLCSIDFFHFGLELGMVFKGTTGNV